jgi:hypothetical protein
MGSTNPSDLKVVTGPVGSVAFLLQTLQWAYQCVLDSTGKRQRLSAAQQKELLTRIEQLPPVQTGDAFGTKPHMIRTLRAFYAEQADPCEFETHGKELGKDLALYWTEAPSIIKASL